MYCSWSEDIFNIFLSDTIRC